MTSTRSRRPHSRSPPPHPDRTHRPLRHRRPTGTPRPRRTRPPHTRRRSRRPIPHLRRDRRDDRPPRPPRPGTRYGRRSSSPSPRAVPQRRRPLPRSPVSSCPYGRHGRAPALRCPKRWRIHMAETAFKRTGRPPNTGRVLGPIRTGRRLIDPSRHNQVARPSPCSPAWLSCGRPLRAWWRGPCPERFPSRVHPLRCSHCRLRPVHPAGPRPRCPGSPPAGTPRLGRPRPAPAARPRQAPIPLARIAPTGPPYHHSRAAAAASQGRYTRCSPP